MKKNIQNLWKVAASVLMVVFLAGCTTDITEEVSNTSEERSMPMKFNTSLQAFDQTGATRAGDTWEWQDGAVVYLQYHVGDQLVRGHAVYTKATDSWEAFYNGTLGAFGKCEVYYFEGASTANKKNVTLTGAEPVFADMNTVYEVNNHTLTVSANLTPLTSRLRFAGTQGVKIQVLGIKYYVGYDAETNTLQTSTDTLSRTVGGDGSTPYIYGVFADEDKRELTVINSIDGNDISFTRTFPTTVLQKGESGFLTIPTSDTNKGWTEKETPKLSVSSNTISLDRKAQSRTVTVTTNVSYTVTSSASWLTATPSSDKKTLTLSVTENTGEDRNATVTLSHAESGLSKKITVTQASFCTFTVSDNGMTVSFNMKLVEAGTFQMGSNDGEEDEKPVHSVTLTKDYYMGVTEVTQGLWTAVMGSNPSYFKNGDDYPVEQVTYDDIISFLTKLNTHLASQLPSGKQFRLPTEAEWEFAAKGGNKSKGYVYSGSNTIDDVAWYVINSSSQTHPVGTQTANELGLYDMSGNVWERCSDWYDSYSSSAQTDPKGPTETKSYRVLRGGGWNFDATYCRPSHRFYNTPTFAYANIGFRLAL